MANQNEALYKQLWKCYRSLYSEKPHPQIDSEMKVLWNRLKKSSDYPNCVHVEIVKLKQKIDSKRNTLHKFWV